jgi:hypothetical protein
MNSLFTVHYFLFPLSSFNLLIHSTFLLTTQSKNDILHRKIFFHFNLFKELHAKADFSIDVDSHDPNLSSTESHCSKI